LVVEVAVEMAVWIPGEAGAKAVAAEAKTANDATKRDIKDIMAGF